MDPARALLEYGELVALVLDGEGKLIEASSRARELFPALELGRRFPMRSSWRTRGASATSKARSGGR